MPTVALIDTDCDPDWVDLPIPGNDDGIRSIELILAQLADAVVQGAAYAVADKEGTEPTAASPAAEGTESEGEATSEESESSSEEQAAAGAR